MLKKISILFILLCFAACSVVKKTEIKAQKGDLTSCMSIVDLYSSSEYKQDNIIVRDKIIKYCKLGLAHGEGMYDSAFFYNKLAPRCDKKNMYLNHLKAAQLGNEESQYITGLYYLDGRGGKINNDSAFYWFKKILNKKESETNYSAMASKQLGDLYEIKNDTLTGLYYYKKACACYFRKADISACEKVILYYKSKNIVDSTELKIYSEIANRIKNKMSYR